MKDVDAIRPPSPRLTRAAVIALALVAGGSFTSGFLRQVVGPLTLQPPPPRETPDGASPVQPIPIAPVVQPALQVATAAPAAAPRPAPELEIPEPATAPAAEAQVAPPDAAAVAPPVDAAATAPAEPPPAEPPPPEEAPH